MSRADKALTTYVYFVRVRNAVKVGWTTHITKRLMAIRCNNPDPIELLSTTAFSRKRAEKIEAECHARLDAQGLRIAGEWFVDGPAIAQEIQIVSTHPGRRAK